VSGTLCVVCQRREPHRPLVCDADRALLGRLLREIPDLYAELGDQAEPAEPVGVLLLDDGEFDAPAAYEVMPLPAGPVRIASGGSRVSGTPEAPVPVSLDLVDLTAPARAGSLLPHANAELHQASAVVVRTKTMERHTYAARWTDQIGHLSVATVLDFWATDWRGARAKGEGLPRPVVGEMCTWLLDRLEDACDDHPAVDEFAADLQDVHSTLRAVLGLTGPWPELLRGVPCRRCDVVSLARLPVGHYGAQQYIECGSCGDLMTPEEYERWTQLLAASVRGRGRMSA
jgi:hypothetical protein